MSTHLNSNHLIKAKIDRLKNKLIKEQEMRIVLLRELRQVEKLEKLIINQTDKQRIAKTRRRIASV